jgi:hypothetical protein
MEAFSVPILLGILLALVIYGIIAGLRRRDDFWEDPPKRRGRRP